MGSVIDDAASRCGPRSTRRRDPREGPGDRLAAVLALLIQEPDALVLFTERAPEMSRHAGEVSFPGGLQEPEDGDLLATALRETREEIGLDPAAPEILGALAAGPHLRLRHPGHAVRRRDRRSSPPLTVSDAEIARVLTCRSTSSFAPRSSGSSTGRTVGVWQGWWYETEDVTVWGRPRSCSTSSSRSSGRRRHG